MEKYLDLKKDKDYTKLKIPANILKKGGLVLFPTETVYGLGANGLDPKAVQKIYKAKGRKSDNPLILHIASQEMLFQIATKITQLEYKLMETFWPGPFTIILPRTSQVPNVTTGGLETVGVRMPSGKIAQELIKYAEIPIAAPSANISGKPSGTNIQDIKEELYEKVDYVIDGGDSMVGLESTVVQVIGGIPTILRPGKITPKQIQEVAGYVKIDEHVLGKIDKQQKVASPGMKYRHYAPKSQCILVYSENNDKLIQKINEIAKQYSKSLILASKENKEKYQANNILEIGHKSDPEEIAQNIFKKLREVDSYLPDIVIIEGIKPEGMGLAIMNRLVRACEYHIINC